MMKAYLIGINYGTSRLIERWIKTFRNGDLNAEVIVVNNFYSSKENEVVSKLSEEHKFEVIQSENIGYGRALNKAISSIKERIGDQEALIICGNIDIEFKSISNFYQKGKYAYIPSTLEGSRNRNPFLTLAQKRVLFLHKYSTAYDSLLMFTFVILILKVMSIFPSKPWAVHGSLFCFNASCIGDKQDVFNDDTFLYSEELEFASYMEKNGVELSHCALTYEHSAHAATFDIISSKRKFFNVWKPSFNNWLSRWYG